MQCVCFEWISISDEYSKICNGFIVVSSIDSDIIGVRHNGQYDHKLWVKYNQNTYTIRTLLPSMTWQAERKRENDGVRSVICDLWVRLHYYCSSECQVVRKLEKFLHIVNQHLLRIRLDYRNGKRHLCTTPHRRILFLKQVNSLLV